MKELTDILTSATAAIGAEFFKLPIDGGDPVFRERVYCYELYHQMRLLWPPKERCPHVLNGEVDKQGHPILNRRGFKGQKPDFLVHGPGDMGLNHAVIEVKPSNGRAIRMVLRSLTLFLNRASYERAIYLIYGERADENLAARIIRHASKDRADIRIEIWLHPEAHRPAKRWRPKETDGL